MLILTTAMNYQEDQDGLIQLISDLNEIQTAGLGIKVSRFLKSIDQKVIDYANSIEFPLIEIPEAWNLGDITHHISSYISDDESEKMNYASNIQQELNHMLIKGYDANLMVERFSKLLKVPIMLINPFDDVEAVSHHYTHNRQLLNENLSILSFISRLKTSNKILNLLLMKSMSYLRYQLLITFHII